MPIAAKGMVAATPWRAVQRVAVGGYENGRRRTSDAVCPERRFSHGAAVGSPTGVRSARCKAEISEVLEDRLDDGIGQFLGLLSGCDGQKPRSERARGWVRSPALRPVGARAGGGVVLLMPSPSPGRAHTADARGDHPSGGSSFLQAVTVGVE
jgi:hypothetical protein